MTNSLAPRFHALFAGMERAHGSYLNINWDQARSDGKYKGDAVTKREPVTDDLWAQHLAGQYGIGIIPIRDDSTCVFGAIDIDVYEDLDLGRVASTVVKMGLPLVPCRSKSGGCHLYLFMKQATDAKKVQAKLRDIAASMGHGTAEIFPKQATMGGDRDLGSWINAPYQNAEATVRYGVMLSGDAMTAEEFLTAAEAAKVGPEFFDAVASSKAAKQPGKKQDPLPDGPPCLNHLMNLGFPPGTWNTGMFNMGIYCRKASSRKWKEQLVELNTKNFPPDQWPASDLDDIIRSLEKKDYAFECSKQPLVGFCNQTECRRRKYGVGGGTSAFPVLKELRKLDIVPPVWFLDVDSNGSHATLELTTEELLDPRAFERKCAERLNTVPMIPTQVVWKQTIQQLMAPDALVIMPPPPEDSSIEGQFWELLESFCNGRAQAHTPDEILGGKPYTQDGRTYFRMSDLLKYLARMQFKDYKVQQVAKVMKMRRDPDGADYCMHQPLHIGKKFVNLWSVPAFARDGEEWQVPGAVKDQKTF